MASGISHYVHISALHLLLGSWKYVLLRFVLNEFLTVPLFLLSTLFSLFQTKRVVQGAYTIAGNGHGNRGS